MRTICVITGSRSEYSLLYYLLKAIKNHKFLKLSLIVTGSHLSREFGNTYKEIEKDGFKIDAKVKILDKRDNFLSISKATAAGLIGFTKAFAKIKPDLIIILGDRYEMLAAASAALYSNIAIAHIHGGENTEGAIDEAIRHSITKMSWFHFTATKKYRQRVIQLGESPSRVFNVGGLGVYAISKTNFYSKKELEKNFQLNLKKFNFLVTMHPVTLEGKFSQTNITALLKVLKNYKNSNIFFTMPNADKDNKIITKKIKKFVSENKKNSFFFKSLGLKNYYSILKNIDAVIGNSSSGIIEAPSFKIATINIGDRQKGRIQAKSIINCNPTEKEIYNAIRKINSTSFKKKLKTIKNPYKNGDTIKKIMRIIVNKKIPNKLNKKFYDL